MEAHALTDALRLGGPDRILKARVRETGVDDDRIAARGPLLQGGLHGIGAEALRQRELLGVGAREVDAARAEGERGLGAVERDARDAVAEDQDLAALQHGEV